MRLLPRRALVALGLSLGLVAVAAAPALAYAPYAPNNAVRAAQRPRDGVSGWTPRSVDFTSGWDATNHNAWMIFGFDYYQQEHLNSLEGSEQFLELSAEVDCAWARVYPPSAGIPVSGREGYEGAGFDTNVDDESALAYEDTIFHESCETGNTGRGTFGVGVLNAQKLIPGKHYFVRVSLSDAGWGFAPPASGVKLSVATGTVYDSSSTWAQQLSTDCSFTEAETQAWNDTTDVAESRRIDASWCAWQDYSHTIVKNDGTLSTGSGTTAFNADKLYNQGVGDGGVGNSGWSFAGGRNATNYCNDSWSAFDGVCFTEMNDPTGTNWSPMWQDVNMASNHISQYAIYTAEAAIRCRTGSTCPMYFAIKGVSSGGGDNEWYVETFNVPNDSHWYVCREDSNHGFPSAFTHVNAAQRFEVGIVSNQTVDIDYALLGGKTALNDPSSVGGVTIGGVGHLNNDNTDNPICTRK